METSLVIILDGLVNGSCKNLPLDKFNERHFHARIVSILANLGHNKQYCDNNNFSKKYHCKYVLQKYVNFSRSQGLQFESVVVITAGFFFCTHREMFPKSYQIKPKSDYIYHFSSDLEQQTDNVRLLFQINQCMVNTT